MGCKSTKSIFYLTLIIGLSFFSLFLPADEVKTGLLQVRVTGIKYSQGGNLIFALYNGKDNWLKKDKVYMSKASEVEEDGLSVSFIDVSYGDSYALFVFHDKNDNEKLDFRKFPFPKPREGVGVSNNNLRMGPPEYGKASFSVSGDKKILEIKMHYAKLFF